MMGFPEARGRLTRFCMFDYADICYSEGSIGGLVRLSRELNGDKWGEAKRRHPGLSACKLIGRYPWWASHLDNPRVA